jgi:ADP-ribose pyrophosphatase
MEKKHGPWTIHSCSVRFENKLMKLVEDKVTQPDGKPGEYATVRMIPGVCVIPIDDEGNIYLTRQFRYALGRENIEAAAGGVEEGETPEDAARREAKEELGIEAEEWEELGPVDPDTSIVHNPATMFVARRLTIGEQETEGSETIEIVKMRFEEAVEKVMAGEITHGATALLILKSEKTFYHQDTKAPRNSSS